MLCMSHVLFFMYSTLFFSVWIFFFYWLVFYFSTPIMCCQFYFCTHPLSLWFYLLDCSLLEFPFDFFLYANSAHVSLVNWNSCILELSLFFTALQSLKYCKARTWFWFTQVAVSTVAGKIRTAVIPIIYWCFAYFSLLPRTFQWYSFKIPSLNYYTDTQNASMWRDNEFDL